MKKFAPLMRWIVVLTTLIAACTPAPEISLQPATEYERIAYACDNESNIDICLIDTDGGNQQRLTKKRYQESSPAWSPDGRHLAYESFLGRGDIYVLPLPQAPGDKPGRTIRLTKNRAADWDPAWSPDGHWLAFASDRDGNFEIYLLDLSDGLQKEKPELLRRLTQNLVEDRFPSWSPDSTRIAYSSGEGAGSEICVIAIDGTEQRCLTEDSHINRDPDWSPDGETIVYYAIDNGMTSHLYSISATGGEPQRLTDSIFNDWHPNWSADGRSILFVSYRAHQDGDAEIFIMDADGSNIRRLTNSPGHDEGPSWSPVYNQVK